MFFCSGVFTNFKMLRWKVTRVYGLVTHEDIWSPERQRQLRRQRESELWIAFALRWQWTTRLTPCGHCPAISRQLRSASLFSRKKTLLADKNWKTRTERRDSQASHSSRTHQRAPTSPLIHRSYHTDWRSLRAPSHATGVVPIAYHQKACSSK